MIPSISLCLAYSFLRGDLAKYISAMKERLRNYDVFEISVKSFIPISGQNVS